jgi:hypothetical protein
MIETTEFKTINEIANKASVEQLYVLQQLFSALIQEKINQAAIASGLIAENKPA